MTLTTLALAPKLDLHALDGVREQILDLRGQDVALDAQDVTHFGALSVQLIRSAALSWASSRHRLSLVNVTPDGMEQLRLLGFTPETLTQAEGTT
ncbi:STAS domain-containing protein [uncultured Aliiroseovarius sp.]|uniref:STAS domain-containing protein n=1 Tax=uncultured Aliiroseovarius sp. TaxID=1658783 RepID=UPI00262C0098|nr:STAS domain-containing protein [uncultured Aliiroseovarius sp.]